MNPQTIQKIVAFLGRVPLNGSEADAFVACLNALRAEFERANGEQLTSEFRSAQ